MKDRLLDPGVRTFLQGLEDAVDHHSLIAHPFYQLWTEGHLRQPVLADYARQYYAQVHAFPTFLSAVHSHCGDLRVRRALLENLLEEERGEENHAELWLRFAEGLTLSRDQTRSAMPLPTTLESVKVMRDLAHRGDFREGVAALWASEVQIAERSRIEREGLEEHYGVTDPRALSFFTVHEEAGSRHARDLGAILASHCLTDESRSRAVQAAASAARTLWNFVDGFYAACVPDEIHREAVNS